MSIDAISPFQLVAGGYVAGGAGQPGSNLQGCTFQRTGLGVYEIMLNGAVPFGTYVISGSCMNNGQFYSEDFSATVKIIHTIRSDDGSPNDISFNFKIERITDTST